MDTKTEIIQSIIRKYNLNLGEGFSYVGATIIQRTEFPQATEVLYCEDGFCDESSTPYIMKALVPKGVFAKDRMIVFYTKDLERCLIPVDGENFTLVGMGVPENVQNINYNKAQNIIHRKSLTMKKEPVMLTKAEMKDVCKSYLKRTPKGRMIFAGCLSSFLWLMIVFIAFAITLSSVGYVDDLTTIAILFGFLALLVVGTIFIIRFFLHLPARLIKNLVYRSDFLVLNSEILLNVASVYGASYENGKFKTTPYSTSAVDYIFIKDANSYEIVHRYSKVKSPTENNRCFFDRKH